MIKANELRLTNLVSVFAFDVHDISEVTCISTEGVSLMSDKNIYVFENFNDISAIPLSEEWLLRFGFEKDGSGFKFKWVSAIKSGGDSGDWYVFPAIIKYVHQLQNFYFVNGDFKTELELKK